MGPGATWNWEKVLTSPPIEENITGDNLYDALGVIEKIKRPKIMAKRIYTKCPKRPKFICPLEHMNRTLEVPVLTYMFLDLSVTMVTSVCICIGITV